MKDLIILQASNIMSKECIEEVQQILVKQKEEGVMILPPSLSLIHIEVNDCEVKIEQPEHYCGDCKYYNTSGFMSYCDRNLLENAHIIGRLTSEDFEACRHFEPKED